MKTPLFFFTAWMALSVAIGITPVEALDGALERNALRRATGVYGAVRNSPIPDGTFKGKVKNNYNEHALMRLKARKGRGRNSARLTVWDGVNHNTRFVRLTARVKKGGRLVKLSGGRVSGQGLLPLGIRIKRGSCPGKVTLGSGKPSLVANCQLAGVDLTNANAPVSGRATFRGKQ